MSGLIGLLLVFGFLDHWLALADSVAQFRFHLSVAAIVAAIALALLRVWKVAGVVCVASIAGFVGMAPAFPDWGRADAAGPAPPLTLVQLNLSFRNRTPGAVVALIRNRQADVVTLQEVPRKTRVVIDALANDYPYVVQCYFTGIGDVAVLSRHPKAPAPAEGCIKRQGLAWLRIIVDGHPVSVASIHLHWPYPYKQASHVAALQRHLKSIPRPVLLAGDFNAAPWSRAVERIAAMTGTRPAGGLRLTLRKRLTRWGPSIGLPIDHVLLPEVLSATTVDLGPPVGSDHLPVIAGLAWR